MSHGTIRDSTAPRNRRLTPAPFPRRTSRAQPREQYPDTAVNAGMPSRFRYR